MENVKVIIWGLGAMGGGIADMLLKKKGVDIVGVVDWEAKVGKSMYEFIKTPKGEYVIDFGQNMTGYVEVTVKGNPGDRIVLHHGEVLDKDGNFYIGNMRSARNENVYILSGGNDVFKPTYTFQGFRYVHIVECPEYLIDKKNFKAISVHSDMKRTGRFACGNEK